MNDGDLSELYQRAGVTRPDPGRPGCPTPEALGAVVLRSGSDADRLVTLDHVMQCADCRAEFELLRAVHAGRPRTRRPLWQPLAAAAVVLFLVGFGVWRVRHGAERPGPFRGESVALSLVAPHPGETLYALPIFVWHSIPNAVTYRVEVVDGNGELVFETTTADTTASVPHTLALSAGVPYRWWVRAQTRAGVTIVSSLIPFQIHAP